MSASIHDTRTTGWLNRILQPLLSPQLAQRRSPDSRPAVQVRPDSRGSPSKAPPSHRSRPTARLAGLAGALVVLGLLAPTAQSSTYRSYGRDDKDAPLAHYYRRLVRPISTTLFPATTSAAPLTDRAGCCGSVSPACPGPYPHLLVYVAVPNAWVDADRRHPLRAQWVKSLALMDKRLTGKGMAGPPPATVLHFVIGLEGLSNKDKAAVDAEAVTHRDFLILPDVTDKDAGEPVSRSSTTLKVMHSMAYAANHYTFDFYARVGDDAYLRVDFLAELILVDHAFPLDRAYIGYKFPDHHIAGSQSTHNFIVGMGFFLTQDLTRYVCQAQDVLLDGFPEDGIVGSWFVGTKVDVIHEPRFHDIDHVTTVAYAPCSNTSLLLHHMWSRKNWEAVDGEGLLEC